jgi:hypothetical protein
MIIQIVLVLAVLAILSFILFGRQTSSKRAWKKISLILLVILMIITIIFPNTINDLAHLLGVGRGADLLLYVLAVAYVWFVVNDYLRQQLEKETLYRLVREIALIKALNKYKIIVESK